MHIWFELTKRVKNSVLLEQERLLLVPLNKEVVIFLIMAHTLIRPLPYPRKLPKKKDNKKTESYLFSAKNYLQNLFSKFFSFLSTRYKLKILLFKSSVAL